MMNLMSVDAQRFLDNSGNFSMIFTSPIQLGIAFYLLWGQLGIHSRNDWLVYLVTGALYSMKIINASKNVIGPSLLAGVGVILLSIPINSVIAARSQRLQVNRMNEKDERMKLISEVLNGIKVQMRILNLPIHFCAYVLHKLQLFRRF